MSLCYQRLSKRRPAMALLYALQTPLDRPTYGYGRDSGVQTPKAAEDWRQLGRETYVVFVWFRGILYGSWLGGRNVGRRTVIGMR